MPSWEQVLSAQTQAEYYRALQARIAAERQAGKIIYPPKEYVLNALALTPLDSVKVVILGQDPYHGKHQAQGLSFSVAEGVKIPPSLRNIYKELVTDIADFRMPCHGNLTPWAKQGVLLLNTVLTVEEGKANSHAKWGWETFTDAIIDAVNQYQQGVVFMLWGKHAELKGQHIDSERHCILTAPHPSPLSAHRGFFGCGHFSKANAYLIAHGKAALNWQV